MPSVPCPSCGFANEVDDVFCGGCRRQLTPEVTAAAPAPAPKGIACPNCSFVNEAGDAFCGGCRRPLLQEAVAPTAASAAHVAAAPAAAPTAAAAPPATAPTAARIPPAAPVVAATVLASGELACPSCATVNPPSRTFCVKCATRLLPEAPKPPRPRFKFKPSMVLPFALSAVIGLGAVVAGARIGAGVLASAPTPSSPPATPVTVTTFDGAPVGFALTPAEPKPLGPLPDKSTIRLAEYEEPDPSLPIGPDRSAPWWSSSAPRIPPVTQFDGGPLEKSNCVMASGAMLARLAFGIVTTGSQLRALQDDQEGASSYGDLDTGLKRGWGVGFLRGSITPLQLRALSYAGAGIVVSLEYGRVPVGVRLQESFTGGHSVYIDAFRPAGIDGPAAYYVMDPIGKTWAGYKGGWWPAEFVEQAALARSGGRIYASWAFAGGVVPDRHRVLPFDAYPDGSPSPSAEPTVEPSAGGPDPMPTGDLPVDADPDTGDTPPEVPIWLPFEINTNLFLVEPRPEGLACSGQPGVAGCPFGIPGVIGPGTPGDPTPPPNNRIEILYANAIAPGSYQIIFDSPPGTDGQLWLWQGSGGPLIQTVADPALIGTNNVLISTVTVDPTAGFSFFATATGNNYSGISTVGSLVIGNQ